eukprot:1485627-Pyramimonas_sp.AAC.1
MAPVPTSPKYAEAFRTCQAEARGGAVTDESYETALQSSPLVVPPIEKGSRQSSPSTSSA